jgi:hypothetical protein
MKTKLKKNKAKKKKTMVPEKWQPYTEMETKEETTNTCKINIFGFLK